MKLLFCPDCNDVLQLRHTFRNCHCHAVEGRYVDDERVEVTGERAEVIGIDSHSLQGALLLVDARERRAPHVNAWLFQHGAERVIRLGRKRQKGGYK